MLISATGICYDAANESERTGDQVMTEPAQGIDQRELLGRVASALGRLQPRCGVAGVLRESSGVTSGDLLDVIGDPTRVALAKVAFKVLTFAERKTTINPGG